MRSVFLSASIPDQQRHPRYHDTADVVAIRDAVRALASVALPHVALRWGGHPAITPLVRVVATDMGVTTADRVQLFQSAWFSGKLPEDVAAFEKYQLTERRATEKLSLKTMREVMLSPPTRFEAGVFIGGMEGVEEEFEMFRELQPGASVWPIATTGAAASLIFEREKHRLDLPRELASEYSYASLFRRLLKLPSGRP